jgi:two-component system response regulator FixJ
MERQRVIIVDDDEAVRDSMRAMLEADGFTVRCHATADGLLEEPVPSHACLVTDIRMPGMSGLELLEELHRRRINLPVIMVTGHADVPLAVRAMKAGALEFIEKPVAEGVLVAAIKSALKLRVQSQARDAEARAAQQVLKSLTPREREILDMLVKGLANKMVAQQLGISHRTVELHRAHIVQKLNVKNLSAMVRLVLAAEGRG